MQRVDVCLTGFAYAVQISPRLLPKVGPVTKSLLAGWSELAGFDIVDRALRNLEEPRRTELLAEWAKG